MKFRPIHKSKTVDIYFIVTTEANPLMAEINDMKKRMP